MDESSRSVQNASAHSLRTHTSQSQFSGARHVTRVNMVCRMVGKTSGMVQKSSTPRKPHSRTRWCRSALPYPRCRAPRPASKTYQARNVPSGRWKKGPGKFRKQAQSCCLVLVHIRVDQRRFAFRVNEDATTLPSVSTRNVPSGRWMKVQKASTHSQPD